MSGWLFLRNFNKQKINNISQRNYINSLVVLTIKIAKATDRTVFAHQANIINTDLFCVIKKIDVLTLLIIYQVIWTQNIIAAWIIKREIIFN